MICTDCSSCSKMLCPCIFLPCTLEICLQFWIKSNNRFSPMILQVKFSDIAFMALIISHCYGFTVHRVHCVAVSQPPASVPPNSVILVIVVPRMSTSQHCTRRAAEALEQKIQNCTEQYILVRLLQSVFLQKYIFLLFLREIDFVRCNTVYHMVRKGAFRLSCKIINHVSSYLWFKPFLIWK